LGLALVEQVERVVASLQASLLSAGRHRFLYRGADLVPDPTWPEVAREDLLALLDLVVPLAQRFLREDGSFLPMGALIGSDGRPQLVVAEPSTTLKTMDDVTQVIRTKLQQAVEQQAARAVAIGQDARVRAPIGRRSSDAILVTVEPQHGAAVNVLLPYVVAPTTGVHYAELLTTPARPSLFT